MEVNKRKQDVELAEVTGHEVTLKIVEVAVNAKLRAGSWKPVRSLRGSTLGPGTRGSHR